MVFVMFALFKEIRVKVWNIFCAKYRIFDRYAYIILNMVIVIKNMIIGVKKNVVINVKNKIV